MDDTKLFELKVGIFVLIGVVILFIIVFSVGDIKLVKQGYHIKVTFHFADGIGGSAPVRLAGVGVGQVEGIKICYDEKEKRSKAELNAWIKEGTRIESDATVTINTLGILGEKYLEISPGTAGKGFMKDQDIVVGTDPIPMGRITANLSSLTDSVKTIVDRIKNGEGTIGKLLTEDKIYKDLEAFVADIKKHPWKLLSKPRGE